MANGGELVGGLLILSIGIFVFYYTNKYYKEGKMREISMFRSKFYSFKKQPKKAFWTMVINCIIGILGIISGIGLLLVHFQILK